MDIEIKMRSHFYSNVDPRRKQEQVDGNMVHEDPSGIANLSDRSVYHTFDPDTHVERLAMFNQSNRRK